MLTRCDDCKSVFDESVIFRDDGWEICPSCLEARNRQEMETPRWGLRCHQPGTVNPDALEGLYRERQDAEDQLQRFTYGLHGLGFQIRDVLSPQGNLERVIVIAASSGWTVCEYEVVQV